MQESQEHYFEEESLYQAITRFEDMIKSNTTVYFDVCEFEVIVDYYLDKHHFIKAEEATKIGLKQHPAASELKIRLAQLYVHSGKPAKGIRLLRDIELLEASNSDFYLLKGTALNLLGKKEESSQAFDEAIKFAADAKDEVVYNIALSYVSNGRYKEAISYLKLAYEINPQNTEVIHELALVYERIDDLQSCVNYYNILLDLEPFNDGVWFNLGLIYSGLDLTKEALNAFDYAIAIRPTNVSALFSKANVLVNENEYKEAIQTYHEIHDVEPSNVQAYTYIGECYDKLGYAKRSIFYFKRALEIDEEFSDAWYGLGIALFQQDNYEESIAYFKKAINIDPENPDFWFMLGEVYRKLDLIEKSAEAYNRTVELDPNDFEAWICRAELSYSNNHDVSGAINILKKAYQFNKDNSTINYQLATYYFHNNQSRLGCDFFEKGLKINFKEHEEFIDDISRKYIMPIVGQLVTKHEK
jgi:tetratricopeptide (TPR) repeat protein